jgi:hypothetical protein
MLIDNTNVTPTSRTLTSRPWQTRTEYLVDQALEVRDIPADYLRQMRPAAAPQNPFPERRGFAQQAWDVNSVLNIDRYTPTYRTWISGMPSMRSQLNDQGSSASTRNTMGAMW